MPPLQPGVTVWGAARHLLEAEKNSVNTSVIIFCQYTKSCDSRPIKYHKLMGMDYYNFCEIYLLLIFLCKVVDVLIVKLNQLT